MEERLLTPCAVNSDPPLGSENKHLRFLCKSEAVRKHKLFLGTKRALRCVARAEVVKERAPRSVRREVR